MGSLQNKTILIISPQSWGTMFVAKHHYALELARRGNQVFFLNPPDNNKYNWQHKSKRIRIEQSAECANLYLIQHKLYFPFLLKFHAKPLFDWLMKKQIKDILSIIKRRVDIVWSFDLGNIYPLSNFLGAYKIFHPVDEPMNKLALQSARNADIIFSVTHEILEKYSDYKIPKYFIHHGVADHFIEEESIPLSIKEGKIRVGMSGNFMRADMDRAVLLNIIENNLQVDFELWGNYNNAEENLGGHHDKEMANFLERLKSSTNVKLHGAVSSKQLSKELKKVDAFLICYDIKKDQSHGTNYHKIMEYLAIGKVIISNNVSTFKGMPDYIQMTIERDTNKQLLFLFQEIIANIEKFNTPELQKKRKAFAKDNTYSKQIAIIEKYISNF